MVDNNFIKQYTHYIEQRLAAMKVIQYYGDLTTIDDIVQEVFKKAVERQDKYDPSKGTIATWLSLLTNDTVSEIKRKTRDAMTHIQKSLDDPTAWVGTDEDFFTGHDVLAEEEGLWAETKRFYLENTDMVDHALSSLSDRVRFVVRSRMIDGMTHREISKVMNISEENSRVMYLRGLQELRIAVAELG